MKGSQVSHERLQCQLMNTSREKLGTTWRLKADGTRKKKTSTAGLTRGSDAAKKKAVKHCHQRSRYESVTNADKAAAQINNLLLSVAQDTEMFRTAPSARGASVGYRE